MKNAKWIQSGAVGISALAMLAAGTPVTFASATRSVSPTASALTSAASWTVDVGAMSQSGIMAMSFFPNVITIDAGDSITFQGEGHTVTFPGADGKLLPPTSPQAQMPAGTSTYDGSTFTSSGILMGNPYALTFTKPGVYPYYCLLHPGMMGVVIVNPAGTQYPMTQAQYDAQAQQQEQADFSAGNQVVANFHLKTKRNANGTTTYYGQNDAPESQADSFDLAAVNQSKVTGSSLIAFAQPPSKTNPEITYSVSAKLSGLTPGQSYTAMLCEGKSGSGVMVPNSQFGSITVNSDGKGTVSGSVQAGGLPQGIWNLDICDASNKVVASGLINHASFAYERYLPATLNIHPGDSVVWTQTGPNEVHTVTFLPEEWKDVPDESLMPVPYGGHIYAGTGFFNSGFIIPGASYEMTFIKTGDYKYSCLLHDVMGMYGDVKVTPQPGIMTVAWNNTVANMPSRVHDGATYVPVWYVMQLLKNAGIQSAWNGRDWNIGAPVSVDWSHVQPGTGPMHIDVNNHLVKNATGAVWLDGKNKTTFLPLDDLTQVLKSLGVSPTWDGNTLDLTPTAHAGSVPSVPSVPS
jgi:plastocyanin